MDLIALGALIRAKRGQAKITQETLALDVFGDSTRKGDISRIENGKVSPQEATLQKLCTALDISDAEMLPIRTARRADEQLANIPSLSREELQNLAARFELENAYRADDAELRRQLTFKADEYRALKSEVDQIDNGLKHLSDLKAAAQDAIAHVDLDKVEELLSRVQKVELEEAAKTAELRANNALLRGKVEQAFILLSLAAESFGAVNPNETARRKILEYFPILYEHSVRYGGSGMQNAANLISSHLNEELKSLDAFLWAEGKNRFGIARFIQGIRSIESKRSSIFTEAKRAFEEAATVLNASDHPVLFTKVQVNIGCIFHRQSENREAAESLRLLEAAHSKFEDALHIVNKGDHSSDWADIQMNLGNVTKDISKHKKPPDNTELLSKAVVHFSNALSVHNQAENPERWAKTTMNLANVFKNLGESTDGAESRKHFTAAISAYSASLQVRTKKDYPLQWAMTHGNLARTKFAITKQIVEASVQELLTEALLHVDKALTVFEPSFMPEDNRIAHSLRAEILADLDAL